MVALTVKGVRIFGGPYPFNLVLAWDIGNRGGSVRLRSIFDILLPPRDETTDDMPGSRRVLSERSIENRRKSEDEEMRDEEVEDEGDT